MTDAPKRIWASTGLYWDYKDDWTEGSWSCGSDAGAEYHRADLSADLVRAGYLAGLEAAAEQSLMPCGYANDTPNDRQVSVADDIRAIAPDQEAIAAIVARVTEGK